MKCFYTAQASVALAIIIEIIMESLTDISKKGGAVIMVTHNPQLAAQAGKRYFLQEGKLAEIG